LLQEITTGKTLSKQSTSKKLIPTAVPKPTSQSVVTSLSRDSRHSIRRSQPETEAMKPKCPVATRNKVSLDGDFVDVEGRARVNHTRSTKKKNLEAGFKILNPEIETTSPVVHIEKLECINSPSKNFVIIVKDKEVPVSDGQSSIKDTDSRIKIENEIEDTDSRIKIENEVEDTDSHIKIENKIEVSDYQPKCDETPEVFPTDPISTGHISIQDSGLQHCRLVLVEPVMSHQTAMENVQNISDLLPMSPFELQDARIAPSTWIRGMIENYENDLSKQSCSSPIKIDGERAELFNSTDRIGHLVNESKVVTTLMPIDNTANLPIYDCSSISYPSDISESAFMVLFGLLPISEVKRREAAAEINRMFRDHRQVGGRLRRNIKYSRAPEMIYETANRFAVNLSRGGVPTAGLGKLKTAIGRKKENENKLQTLLTDLAGSDLSAVSSDLVDESKESPALQFNNEKQAFVPYKVFICDFSLCFVIIIFIVHYS